MLQTMAIYVSNILIQTNNGTKYQLCMNYKRFKYSGLMHKSLKYYTIINSHCMIDLFTASNVRVCMNSNIIVV